MLDFNRKIEYHSLNRIEGDRAILIADDESRREIPLSRLPTEHRKEGCVFFLRGRKWHFAPRETERRIREIQTKFQAYTRKDNRS